MRIISNFKDYYDGLQDFSKVLNSHQIYQELDYYSSNVMIKKETIEEPDDIIKLESKGFDKVISFRKRKETENE